MDIVGIGGFLFLEMTSSLVFSVLSLSFFASSMLSVIKLTSDWTLATSSLHRISLQYAMSSAYMLRLEFLEMDSLLMVSTERTKSSGPGMDP